MNLAVIPARLGSTRIKNKNIVAFQGKPMIAWSILAARKSKLFDYICVSTDSKKISSIAKKYGASVPFLRSKKLSNNFTPVHDVTFDTIVKLEKKMNLKFENVVQLMPNCPFRNEKDIITFFKYFKKHKLKYLISCTNFSFNNPWWAFYKKKNNIQMLFPKNYKKRSQDLNELFSPTGAIWIAKINNFLNSKSFYSPGFKFLKLNWKSAIDIDSPEELQIAKSLKAK